MPTGSMSGLLTNVKLNKICHKTTKIEQDLSVNNKVRKRQIIVSFIRTRLSPGDTSGLTSFPDY